MKNLLFCLLILLVSSCGMKVAYTDQVKKDYSLTEDNLKKVQFFTSATIILQRKNSIANQGTSEDGALISNENSVENRIIIPANTRCVFEKIENDGSIFVRFEEGQNKYLPFILRKGQQTGKYYINAKWDANKGGELDYGNLTYFATAESGGAYLLVVTKKLKRTKRKDRIVKGMKV